MNFRDYNASDKEACLKVFESNCPKFFDPSEFKLFEKWLDHQANSDSGYRSPTYTNSEKDAYYVLETEKDGIIGCAGFYILKEEKEARLAWGMVHAEHHHQGAGTILFKEREKIIKENWPSHVITLGTSQHTFAFYEKMGMKVLQSFKQGYGKDLDRYDMQIK